jgi:hypothetical protein
MVRFPNFALLLVTISVGINGQINETELETANEDFSAGENFTSNSYRTLISKNPNDVRFFYFSDPKLVNKL